METSCVHFIYCASKKRKKTKNVFELELFNITDKRKLMKETITEKEDF